MSLDQSDIAPRRVLVLAYYFPPMGLSGVQRTVKFVKYLPHFGWHPTVLTVQGTGYFAKDETLLQEIDPAVTRVVRTPQAGPAKLFGTREVVKLPPEWIRKLLSRVSDTVFIPDNKRGWKMKAVTAAIDLHRATPFDLIFATAPPFTSFIVGKELKKYINRPLVFDYRDPWVDYPFKFYPTPFHKLAHIHLEKNALRASSHIVTTNRRVKEILLRRYRFLTYHDVDIITQGFDPADFEHLPGGSGAREGEHQRVRASTLRKMKVTYAGIFWEDRVPDYFLKALHDLFREKPRLRGRIEAVFIGNFREENRKLVVKLGLQDAVVVHEYLPHQECVRHLVDADLLWMIVGDDVASPGKVYEYIGARKPILGCAPEGFIKNTILEAGGIVVGPKNVAGIKDALEHFYGLFETHRLQGPPEEVVQKYSRVALTGTLVKLFESLLAP